MKGIGSTFGNELRAAGISLDGLAWSSDGTIEFDADVPLETRKAVSVVYDNHDPVKAATIAAAMDALVALDVQSNTTRQVRDLVLQNAAMVGYISQLVKAISNTTALPTPPSPIDPERTAEIVAVETQAAALRASINFPSDQETP